MVHIKKKKKKEKSYKNIKNNKILLSSKISFFIKEIINNNLFTHYLGEKIILRGRNFQLYEGLVRDLKNKL